MFGICPIKVESSSLIIFIRLSLTQTDSLYRLHANFKRNIYVFSCAYLFQFDILCVPSYFSAGTVVRNRYHSYQLPSYHSFPVTRYHSSLTSHITKTFPPTELLFIHFRRSEFLLLLFYLFRKSWWFWTITEDVNLYLHLLYAALLCG